MNSRCGSQMLAAAAATAVTGAGGVCGGGSGGQGGGVAGELPVATPGEFAGGAVRRFCYDRIVLRSIPVNRSISRWLLPARSRVSIVVCMCGFKTFTPGVPLVREGRMVTSCPGPAPARLRPL